MIGEQRLAEALVRQSVKHAIHPAQTAYGCMLREAGVDPDAAYRLASIHGLREGGSVSEASAVARAFLLGLAVGRTVESEER